MKSLGVVVFTFIAVSSFAATKNFKIDSKVFVDSRLVSNSKFVVNPGETAESVHTSKDKKEAVKIKVTALEANNARIKNGIYMKFDVQYNNGKRIVHTSPEILTRANSEATILVANEDGSDEIKLKVRAQ